MRAKVRPAKTSRLPNFVVVGAPKCGTTSLYHYLRQHPDIFLPERKELHYFSYPYIAKYTGGPGDEILLATACKTFETYREHYANAAGEAAVGDMSPSYFYYAEAGDEIRATLDDPRIVLVVRDPIEKAFSQYMHLVRDNRETLGFHAALMAEAERIRNRWAAIWRYAEGSLFAARTRRVLDTFGPDRVKIVLFEEMVRAPERVLGDIFAFLDVDPTFRPRVETVYNRSGAPRSRALASLLAKPNPIRLAAKRLLPATLVSTASRLLQGINTGGKPPLDAASRDYLRDYFAEDVADLERLLSRRLNWLDGGSGKVSKTLG